MDQIAGVVGDVQRIYAIVLALSIGEAFKQFVADAHRRPEDRRINWDQLLALAAFLFLAVPFFQGMNRHFSVVYAQGHRPDPYSVSLLFDCAAFTIEGGLFFVLSRSLPHVQWQRFYLTVVVLLIIDVLWGWIVHGHNPDVVLNWVLLDSAFIVVFLLVLFGFWRDPNPYFGAAIGMVIAIIRTVFDYLWMWDFYFPES